MRWLKCLLVGHADDFLVAGRSFCLRCHRFTQARPVGPRPPLDAQDLAYLRAQGWTEDLIRDTFAPLQP